MPTLGYALVSREHLWSSPVFSTSVWSGSEEVYICGGQWVPYLQLFYLMNGFQGHPYAHLEPGHGANQLLLPGLQCGAPEASTPSFGCEQSLHFPGSFCQVRGRSPMGLLFEVAAVNQRLVLMREKSIICPGLQSATGFRVYI